jgi:hypothetical protein
MAVEKNVFEVRLFVKGEKVAESNDVALWQAVFSTISRSEEGGDVKKSSGDLLRNCQIDSVSKFAFPALTKFAEMVGIDEATLQGACDPQQEEPYLHLDIRCWAEWVKNVPQRGRSSMSAISLTATLLCLWFQSAGFGNPTLQHVLKILSDIGAEGSNPTRSIKNCSWIQLRGGQMLQLNPAAIAQAVETAKAFCEKRQPKYKTT